MGFCLYIFGINISGSAVIVCFMCADSWVNSRKGMGEREKGSQLKWKLVFLPPSPQQDSSGSSGWGSESTRELHINCIYPTISSRCLHTVLEQKQWGRLRSLRFILLCLVSGDAVFWKMFTAPLLLMPPLRLPVYPLTLIQATSCQHNAFSPKTPASSSKPPALIF